MSIFYFFQTDYKRRATKTGVPQILTIPYSHYNELAKWSWDIMGKKFEEHAFAPGGHIIPVQSLRVPNKAYSDSSFIQSVKESSLITEISSESDPDPKKAEDRSKSVRSTAVPVMVLPNGTILADSWSIVAASGLQPIKDLEFKKVLDEQLGPLARQHAYMYILRNRQANRSIWNGLSSDMPTYGWLWWMIWWSAAGYFVTERLTETFQPNNKITNADCVRQLKQVMENLSLKIENRTTKYLYGDVIGAEDIALASLTSILVFPDEFCRGKYNPYFIKLQQDDDFKRSVEEFRATALGQYTLEIYKNHRLTTIVN